MSKNWNLDELKKLITDEAQESLTLEYKAADALWKSDGKKKEITKDVSAMANSAGGTIIYGLAEYQEAEKKHLPEKLDPVDQTKYSKEWLEQVINAIRPHIEGVLITPVAMSTSSENVVYVVVIPQSTTAHQATDFRYYKRFNFLSVPMEDYEVRDVMSREKLPNIELEFEIEVTTQEYLSDLLGRNVEERTEYQLKVIARNVGQVYAHYVNVFIQLPVAIAYKDEFDEEEPIQVNEGFYVEYYKENTVRDVVDVDPNLFGPINKYGPSRYDPILPKLSRIWGIRLNDSFPSIAIDDLVIKWSVFADNAQSRTGQQLVKDIYITDLRSGDK